MGDNHFNERWLHNAVNEIDAGMFSADTFDDATNRERLRWWMARWERGLQATEKAIAENPELALEALAEDKRGVEADKAMARALGEKLPDGNSVAALPAPAKVFHKAGDGTETEHDMRQFWSMVNRQNIISERHVAIWQLLYDKGIATPSDVIEGLKVWNDWRADI